MSICNPVCLMEQPRQFREHYYETEDAMEAVAAPGYFAPAAHMLAVGDLIKVRATLPDDIIYEEFLVTHVNVARGAVTLQPRAMPAAKPAPAPAPAAPKVSPRPKPASASDTETAPRKPAARKVAARKEG